MITLNYSPEGYTGAHVEMRVPDNSMNVDQVLDYVQRFLTAAGYNFDESETIKVVRRENELNFLGSPFGDTIIGGAYGTDTISFHAAAPVTLYGGEGTDTITFEDHLWG